MGYPFSVVGFYTFVTVLMVIFLLLLESRDTRDLEPGSILRRRFSKVWGPFIDTTSPSSFSLLVEMSAMRLSRLPFLLSEIPQGIGVPVRIRKALTADLFSLLIFGGALFALITYSSYHRLSLCTSVLGFIIYRFLRAYRRFLFVTTDCIHIFLLFCFFISIAVMAVVATASGAPDKWPILTLPLSFFLGFGLAWPWTELKLRRRVIHDERFLVPLGVTTQRYFQTIHRWRYSSPLFARVVFFPYRVLVLLRLKKPTRDYFKVWACLICETKDYQRVIGVVDEGDKFLAERGEKSSDTLRSLKILALIHLGSLTEAKDAIAKWQKSLEEKSAPPHAFLLHNQAYLFWQTGEVSKGIHAAQEAVRLIEELQPIVPVFESVAVLRLLAQLYCEQVLQNATLQGSEKETLLAEAEAAIKKARSILPKRQHCFSLTYTEGLLALCRGRLREAAQTFFECVAFRNHKGAHFRLAILMMIGTYSYTRAEYRLQILSRRVPTGTAFHHLIELNLARLQKAREEKIELSPAIIEYHARETVPLIPGEVIVKNHEKVPIEEQMSKVLSVSSIDILRLVSA